MSVGFQKPKIKSRSAGPGGKKPGTSCHGKNPVFLSIAAIPKDSPTGSSDWVTAKNSGTSSASGGGEAKADCRVAKWTGSKGDDSGPGGFSGSGSAGWFLHQPPGLQGFRG